MKINPFRLDESITKAILLKEEKEQFPKLIEDLKFILYPRDN